MPGEIVAILIVLIVIAGITVSITSYFRLQRHRADAVAMANYRRLAEESVANLETLRGEIAELTQRVASIEKLLRSID